MKDNFCYTCNKSETTAKI